MTPPTILSSVCDEYFIPGTSLVVDPSATFFVSMFADQVASDPSSGFTVGGQPMTKLTGFFAGFGGIYGAYRANPPTGSQPITWTGLEGTFASCAFGASFAGVASVLNSGAGYASSGTGDTVYATTVAANSNCLVVASVQLPPPQRAATIVPLSGCTIRTDLNTGDSRHMIVTAPGAGGVTIGVSSSVPDFSGIRLHVYILLGFIGTPEFVKLRLKLHGT